MEPTLDALVIGGGPAGSTVASQLASSGWRVGLVEKAAFPRPKVCGEFISATNWPWLQELGVATAFRALAGPTVDRLGFFAGESVLTSEPLEAEGNGWGRALSREHLDQLLLDRSIAWGVRVWQPWSVVELREREGLFRCRLAARSTRQELEVLARIVIAAHGSWEPGRLPSQRPKGGAHASDLLAFKAHFRKSGLAPGLMPLLAFPGGYGGMVRTDSDQVSLSCCLRRQELEACRRAEPGSSAAEAVFRHVCRSCAGVRDTLAGATVAGAWLSAGPIRPGIRLPARHRVGYFLVGNAAGEAHPVIAEGITMAVQGGRLLGEQLTSRSDVLASRAAMEEVGATYAAEWRRNFGTRVWASKVIAAWAMSAWAVKVGIPLLRRWPGLLSAGARLSGKARFLSGIGVAEKKLSYLGG